MMMMMMRRGKIQSAVFLVEEREREREIRNGGESAVDAKGETVNHIPSFLFFYFFGEGL